MSKTNRVLIGLATLGLIIVCIVAIFIWGRMNCAIWADYDVLESIISGLSFLGVLFTIYVQSQNSQKDLMIRHILLQVEMTLKFIELHPEDIQANSEHFLSITYLEEELEKISGFKSDYVYWRKKNDGFIN